MFSSGINNPINRLPAFFNIYLTRVGALLPVLFSTFFSILLLVPQIADSQQGRPVKQDLFSVSFPTEQQGWACGRWGTVLYSGDGGRSWTQQNSSTDFTLSSICFVDAKTGWAVGEKGSIIHTKDGGQHWAKQKCPVDYFLMGAYFVDAQKGWAVTEWTTILYTEDGGKNWEVQFKDDDYILKAVSFCDPLNGWAVGEYGYIYHTADGGRNWEHQAGSFTLTDSFELIGGNTLFDVVAIDPMRAWVVGIDGYIAGTPDGGATWDELKSDVPKTQLFGISSDRQGDTLLIGGKGILLASPDRGIHFTNPKVEPPVTYGWIYGITPRGSKGFAAVGKEGWIYLGDAGGKAWQRSETPRGN